MSSNGHFDYALASDETQRLLLNGALHDAGYGAYAISKANWGAPWPKKLIAAVRRGLPPDIKDDD